MTSIGVEDLAANIRSTPATSIPCAAGRTLKEALAGPERQIILEVLESNNWNRNATADSLGINRTTLYKKMKRLGLEDPVPGRAARHISKRVSIRAHELARAARQQCAIRSRRAAR